MWQIQTRYLSASTSRSTFTGPRFVSFQCLTLILLAAGLTEGCAPIASVPPVSNTPATGPQTALLKAHVNGVELHYLDRGKASRSSSCTAVSRITESGTR